MIPAFIANALSMLAAIRFEHWCTYCGAQMFGGESIAQGYCAHHDDEWFA